VNKMTQLESELNHTYVTPHGFVDRSGALIPDVGLADIIILNVLLLAMLTAPLIGLSITWNVGT